MALSGRARPDRADAAAPRAGAPDAPPGPLYLYAILDTADEIEAARPGLGGRPVCSVTYRGLGAAVSPGSPPGPLPTEEEVWCHEEVIEALMARCTLLPVRFGTVLPDREAVRALLQSHHAAFRAALDRVRGRVEMGLRVLWPADPEPSAPGGGAADGLHQTAGGLSPGRLYMQSRLAEERRSRSTRARAQTLAHELDARLAECCAERRLEILPTSRMPLTAVYLLDREQVPVFRAEVDRLRADHPLLGLLCSGPWPPYSFVGALTEG